jgi:hypothetical protein
MDIATAVIVIGGMFSVGAWVQLQLTKINERLIRIELSIDQHSCQCITPRQWRDWLMVVRDQNPSLNLPDIPEAGDDPNG